MDVVEKIRQLVEPSLDAMGYDIVQLRLNDAARRKTLSVMAERRDENPMGFDDCTTITQAISALLDVEDPISGAYDLEVCSPGLDRPLTRPKDFIDFAGHEIKLETLMPLDGRKRFRGILQGLKDEEIVIYMAELDPAEHYIPLNYVRTAKLMAPAPSKGQKKQLAQQNKAPSKGQGAKQNSKGKKTQQHG